MKDKYIEDLKEIRDIMDRSSRFISLSGLARISTGIIALIGCYLAYQMVFKGQDLLVYHAIEINNQRLTYLLLIALGTLILSIASEIFFTAQKIKKSKQRFWNPQTKRLLINLSIPLLTGGILCLMLLPKGFVGLLPPLTLIFYGLALVNASKYTLSEIRSLGIIEILIGLMAVQFIDLGLIFWAMGFGVVQMLYGIIIQRKYK